MMFFIITMSFFLDTTRVFIQRSEETRRIELRPGDEIEINVKNGSWVELPKV
jgi:hypothetical protein